MTYSGQEGFGKGRFSVAVSLVRWLLVLIALVGVASIGACGSRGNDSDGDDAPQQPAAAATVAATMRRLIEAIPEAGWTPIEYWLAGGADVAETTYTPLSVRLIRGFTARALHAL